MPGPQDRSITIQASTAVVTSIQFTKVGATITATAFGSVTESDGTVISNPITYVLSGAADTTVRNYMDGQALTKWRTANGIEAP